MKNIYYNSLVYTVDVGQFAEPAADVLCFSLLPVVVESQRCLKTPEHKCYMLSATIESDRVL